MKAATQSAIQPSTPKFLCTFLLLSSLCIFRGCLAFSLSQQAPRMHPSSFLITPHPSNLPSPSVFPPKLRQQPTSKRKQALSMSDQDRDRNPSVWSPQLRKIMGGIASVGVVETGYLTYTKLFTETKLPAFCGTSGSCESVLTGPYSTIPYTDIPLSTLGLVAYSLVLYLSVSPLLQQQQPSPNPDDTQNRILLTALATCMGTFSIFLMSILFAVLHQTCPYCIFSAACSILLAQLAWIGGCLPENNASSISKSIAVASSVLVPTAAALLLYFASPAPISPLEYTISGQNSNSLIASTATGSTTTPASGEQQTLCRPPEITAVSTERATALAKELKSLNAKMYGAHWCSHCYDQKQVFGKEAFESYIKYIECSKDGVNSQSKLCKVMDVPGYPTWEIQGKLYPGQLELDELEELVEGIVNK